MLDYHARFYDPRVGRFVSADTVVAEPSNPQAWNRYAYVLNTPIRYDDPSGHCPPDGVTFCQDIPQEGAGSTILNELETFARYSEDATPVTTLQARSRVHLYQQYPNVYQQEFFSDDPAAGKRVYLAAAYSDAVLRQPLNVVVEGEDRFRLAAAAAGLEGPEAAGSVAGVILPPDRPDRDLPSPDRRKRDGSGAHLVRCLRRRPQQHPERDLEDGAGQRGRGAGPGDRVGLPGPGQIL